MAPPPRVARRAAPSALPLRQRPGGGHDQAAAWRFAAARASVAHPRGVRLPAQPELPQEPAPPARLPATPGGARVARHGHRTARLRDEPSSLRCADHSVRRLAPAIRSGWAGPRAALSEPMTRSAYSLIANAVA